MAKSVCYPNVTRLTSGFTELCEYENHCDTAGTARFMRFGWRLFMSCSTSPQVKCLYSVTIMNELSKKFVHSLYLGVE